MLISDASNAEVIIVKKVSRPNKSNRLTSSLSGRLDTRKNFNSTAGLAARTKSGRVLSPLREEIKQCEPFTVRHHSRELHAPLKDYNSYLNQVKNTNDLCDGINVNLLKKKSYVFNMKEAFYVRDYDAVKNLFKQVSSWIDSNPRIDNEIKFVEYEKAQIQDLGDCKVEQSYLIVPVYTRCYSPINITLYDEKVRLSRLKDYWVLFDICQYIFDTMRGFPASIHADRYRDFVQAWERDEYDQEAMIMNWSRAPARENLKEKGKGENLLDEHKQDTLDKHSIYDDHEKLVRKNRELERDLEMFKHRCKKLAGILNKNYTENWSNITGSFMLNLTKKLDSPSRIPGLDSPIKKNQYVDIESPTAKLWKRDGNTELCSPAKSRLMKNRNDVKVKLDKNVKNIPTIKLD